MGQRFEGPRSWLRHGTTGATGSVARVGATAVGGSRKRTKVRKMSRPLRHVGGDKRHNEDIFLQPSDVSRLTPDFTQDHTVGDGGEGTPRGGGGGLDGGMDGVAGWVLGWGGQGRGHVAPHLGESLQLAHGGRGADGGVGRSVVTPVAQWPTGLEYGVRVPHGAVVVLGAEVGPIYEAHRKALRQAV